MDRYQLKNIIIIILLLVNGFLLGSLIARDSAARAARTRSAQQLVELFAEDNLALDPEVISDKAPPSAYALSKTAEREQAVASFFLGKSLSHAQEGDGVYTTYTSPKGAAMFRSDGSFDIAGTLATEDVESFCRSFCETFSYTAPELLLDDTGSGTAEAVYRYNKNLVFNASVTFTISQGTLTMVSGTLLPESGTMTESSQEPLSATAALIAFQTFRRESGASASAIEDMYPCYELQSTAATPMLLSPSWCIVTDIAKYYVNCVSGAVNPG